MSNISKIKVQNTTYDVKDTVSGYATTEAMNSALAEKQNSLVSGTNIKTVNGNSLLGSGNVSIPTGKDYAENNPQNGAYIQNRPGGYDFTIYNSGEPITYSDSFTRDSEEYDYILEDVIGETYDDWTLWQILKHGYTIPCTYVPTDGELAGETLNGTIAYDMLGEGITLNSATGDDSTEAGSLSIDLSAIPNGEFEDDIYHFPIQFPSKYIPHVFEEGTGTNSGVQKGNLGKVYGDNAIAEGVSFFDPEDEYNISPSSTDSAIITAWSTYIGDEDNEHKKFTLVKGEAAHAEGNNGLALGNNSHVEGNGCIAGDNSSHAEGTGARAMGKYSHAEGLETRALGSRSHAEGYESVAYNKESHAEGTSTVAGTNPDGIDAWSSTVSYSSGNQVIYDGYVYTASKNGKNKKPSGGSTYWRREEGQHAEGKGTLASARASHAEGNATQATALAAHAEGDGTTASADGAHAEGGNTIASYKYAHAEGKDTKAIEWASHTEGYNTEVGGDYYNNSKTPDTDGIAGQMAHTEGNATLAKGNAAHSEGKLTFAKGDNSHAEGETGNAIGRASHVEGGCNNYELYLTKAEYSESDYWYKIESGSEVVIGSACGNSVIMTVVYNADDTYTVGWLIKLSEELSDDPSTIENQKFIFSNIAQSNSSHSEGDATLAQGVGAHAEGFGTQAKGDYSHAEGVAYTTVLKHIEYSDTIPIQSATTESRLYQVMNGSIAAETVEQGWKLYSIDGTPLGIEENITVTKVYTGTSKWFQLSEILGIGNKKNANFVFITFETQITVSGTEGALGVGSHVEGMYTVARNNYEHAEGKFNISLNGKSIHTVGIGSLEVPKNAHLITNDGKHYIPGIGGYQGTESNISGKSDLATVINSKIDSLTFDNTPTENSNNPVKSSGIYNALTNITNLIPYQAYDDGNKLADKDFVNSSISTATATFKGTYNIVSRLNLTTSATTSQVATALASAVSGADNNDYAFVQIPTADETPTEIARVDRYKYNGTAWVFEYTLNNSGMTAAQWAAVNSGITAAGVNRLYSMPSGPEIYIADYGNTTFDTIKNWKSSSKTIICRKSHAPSGLDKFYYESARYDNAGSGVMLEMVFSRVQDGKYEEVSVTENGWQSSTDRTIEITSNRVTSISASSTDTQYPSAKCVYDMIGNVESLLSAI